MEVKDLPLVYQFLQSLKKKKGRKGKEGEGGEDRRSVVFSEIEDRF